MTGNLSLFSSTRDIKPAPVGLPDGLQTMAIKSGIISLTPGITLRHVLYVPNLTINLIFVSRLSTDAQCYVVFSHDVCILQDRTTRDPIGLGRLLRGGVHFPASANSYFSRRLVRFMAYEDGTFFQSSI